MLPDTSLEILILHFYSAVAIAESLHNMQTIFQCR